MMSKTDYDKQAKIWRGRVTESKFGQQDSIGAVVLDDMRKHPDHIMQICYQSGRQFTKKEMCQLSIQTARHFGKLNMEQCDVIGLCAANSDYVAPLFFGAMFSGLCISTSDVSFNINGLKHVYSMSRPKLMFCDGDVYPKVRQALDESGLSSSTIYTVRNHVEGVPSILEFFEETGNEDDFQVPPLKNGGEQVALIICTSGSTGLPKGVCMSHISLLNAALQVSQGPTITICFSSLYWSMGVMILIQSGADCVTRVISEQPFKPEDLFDIVKRYKVTMAALSPSFIPICLASDKLASSDLSSLRFAIATGKTTPYSLIEKFRSFAPNCMFITAYGMTELCSGVSTTLVEPTNSVGQVTDNIEVKILDDEGNQLGPNEKGELCLRTKFKWAGYLNNPEATKERYDEDRWVHSGDIGYFNDAGQLYIVDRRTDIFKYNNFHFSPNTIEKVIYGIPDVAEVCVVGIPDSTYDFLPAAAIVKRPGANISESDISQYVKERMQQFENLHGGVYFFDSFPQTASGKVIRKEVTDLIKSQRK